MTHNLSRLEIVLGKTSICYRNVNSEGVVLSTDTNMWSPLNRTVEEIWQRVIACWPGLARYPLNQVRFVVHKPLFLSEDAARSR